MLTKQPIYMWSHRNVGRHRLRKRLVINGISKIIYDLKDVVFLGNKWGTGYEGDGVQLGDRGQLGYKLIYYL